MIDLVSFTKNEIVPNTENTYGNFLSTEELEHIFPDDTNKEITELTENSYIGKKIKEHKKNIIITFYKHEEGKYEFKKELCIFNYKLYAIPLICFIKREKNFYRNKFNNFTSEKYGKEYITSEYIIYSKKEEKKLYSIKKIIEAVKRYNGMYINKKYIPEKNKDINVYEYNCFTISIPKDWFEEDKIFDNSYLGKNNF